MDMTELIESTRVFLVTPIYVIPALFRNLMDPSMQKYSKTQFRLKVGMFVKGRLVGIHKTHFHSDILR